MIRGSRFNTSLFVYLLINAGIALNPGAYGADGPYCGIYAVYGAASALSARVEFDSLVDSRFVSSRAGSTTNDLVNAAKHLGVKAMPLSGLGSASLRESRDPLVLHIASFGQLEVYNHWLLFLGMENGKARTVDGTGSVHLMEVGELLARWDGVAVAVFRTMEPQTRFGSVELAACGWWLLVVCVTIAYVTHAVQRMSLFVSRPTFIPVMVLGISTVVLVTAREIRSERSLLRNPDFVRFINVAEGLKHIPDISFDEMKAFSDGRKEGTIFDVRYSGDMNYGHIPGAMGLPVDSTQEQVAAAVWKLPREQTIVLYCQSARC